jgi:hypothetical protein
MMCTRIRAFVAVAGALALGATLQARQPQATAGGGDKQDHVAALKQSLQQGQTLIRQYEWIETTVIKMKGEEKSRKQNRCYYGADGKVQKVPVGEAAPPQESSGGGGRPGRRGGGKMKEQVIEKKKDEMSEYMQRAAGLIHQYVPPDPTRIQSAKEGGRVAANPQPGGRVRLTLSQYLLPGDSLTIDLDAAVNRLLGLGVSSYLDTTEDPVTLAVQMATLTDGALYAAQTTLDAKAKNIQVVIQNSGHRPLAQ